MNDRNRGSVTRRDLLAAGLPRAVSAERAQGLSRESAEPPLRRARRVAIPFSAVSRQEDIATYVLALRPGQEIVSTLLDFAREKRLVSGSLSAIGAVSDAQIACFDPVKKEYRQVEVCERAEVASLVGGLGLTNGQPFLHVHAVLRLRDGSTRTGHLLEAHVFSTLRVTLTGWAQPLHRARGVEAGLKPLSRAS